MVVQTTGRGRDCLLITVWLTTFVACFWLVEEVVSQWELFGPNMLSRKIHGFVLLALVLAIPYWLLLRRKRLNVPVAYAALLVFLVASLSPTALQTDQIRYIWDGILTMRGENPYTLAPADHPFFAVFPGNQQLNHAHLPTIYPPLAQLVFALSTVFNPMLWCEYLGWEWAPFQMPALGFTLEIGWKIMAGLVAALSLVVLRAKRWDLFFLHPLILITWLGNSHVDLVMCACLIFLFEGRKSQLQHRSAVSSNSKIQVASTFSAIRESIVLSAGILAKGTPLLFIPFFAVRWFRKLRRLAVTVGVVALCCALVAAPVIYFHITSQGNFFHSPKVFARNWAFFGYLNGFLGDLARVLGFSDPQYWARIAGLSIWIPIYLCLIALALRSQFSTRLLSFLVYASFLWFSPTLHPWYLIVMLYLGLPFIHLFPVIWVWPVLALTSQTYYIDNIDPIVLRMAVYTIVTFLNIQLIRVVWKHRRELRKATLGKN